MPVLEKYRIINFDVENVSSVTALIGIIKLSKNYPVLI